MSLSNSKSTSHFHVVPQASNQANFHSLRVSSAFNHPHKKNQSHHYLNHHNEPPPTHMKIIMANTVEADQNHHGESHSFQAEPPRKNQLTQHSSIDHQFNTQAAGKARLESQGKAPSQVMSYDPFKMKI
mmetsp:Transcript_2/g.2  ORF Transcript_2/g.2 Transcript_2/m.2 type:complete len:129 (-) Transcript_2:127-513(-)